MPTPIGLEYTVSSISAQLQERSNALASITDRGSRPSRQTITRKKKSTSMASTTTQPSQNDSNKKRKRQTKKKENSSSKFMIYVGAIRGKEVRKRITRNIDLIRWITIDDETRNAAKRIRDSGVLDMNISNEELTEKRRIEYHKFYAPERLCSSNRQLTLELSVALLRALNFGSKDKLIDLGCSRGRLVIASYLTTNLERIRGVELSPSDCEIASEARRRCLEGKSLASSGFDKLDTSRLEPFLCSDLRIAPLEGYNVMFCAIRGNKIQAKVLDDLIVKVLEVLDAAKKKGKEKKKKIRLILAGFGLDKVTGTPLEGRVKLICAYAFRSDENDESKKKVSAKRRKTTSTKTEDDDDDEDGEEEEELPIACYGGAVGPRFMLEYSVE